MNVRKIRNWLIRALGGITPDEAAPLFRKASLFPQRLQAAYRYFIEPDTPEVRRMQQEYAKAMLARKIGEDLMDSGMVHLKFEDEKRDVGGHAIPQVRLTATAWVLDARAVAQEKGGSGG